MRLDILDQAPVVHSH